MANKEEMTGMEAGQMLASVPLDSMIASLGIGIARAQEALDTNSIMTATKLAELTMEFPGPLDDSGQITTVSRSLLSLGFVPTFYQFTEATLDIRIEMKMQVEESKSMKASAEGKVDKGPVAIGGSVSADSSRKYGAESSAMTAVHVVMVAVPPPAEFLDYVRKNAT
jgi:hypothetical protein